MKIAVEEGSGAGSPSQHQAGLRSLVAVLIGNALEFYDFLSFSFFATQISRCFFPGSTDQDRLLLALATFGAGFLTRPIGGIVLGRLADRKGRRPVLQISFAMMGIGIAGLALTPSYASIGLAAPLLVLIFRLIQGFALGGDVGTATAYMVESAPAGRRGLYVSLQYSTQGIAVLAAGLIGGALAVMLSPTQLDAWGWRIAFLIGVSVVPLGLVLRGGLAETLTQAASDAPPATLRGYRRIALSGLFLLGFGTIGNYAVDYIATYAQVTLRMSSAAAFGATIVIGIVSIACCPLAGWLSDRFGRRPVVLAGIMGLLLLSAPCFLLLVRFPFATPLFAIAALLSIGQALSASPALAAVTEALPPRSRATGVALIYALAITLFGGTTQFLIAWLGKLSGSLIAPGWYLSATAAVALIALLFLPETAAPNRSRPVKTLVNAG